MKTSSASRPLVTPFTRPSATATRHRYFGPRGPVSGNGRTWPKPNGSGRREIWATGSGTLVLVYWLGVQCSTCSLATSGLDGGCRCGRFEPGSSIFFPEEHRSVGSGPRWWMSCARRRSGARQQADRVGGRRDSAQWSARKWMAFTTQRLSVEVEHWIEGRRTRVQSLLEPGYRQTGWDSPTSRSQRVLAPVHSLGHRHSMHQ